MHIIIDFTYYTNIILCLIQIYGIGFFVCMSVSVAWYSYDCVKYRHFYTSANTYQALRNGVIWGFLWGILWPCVIITFIKDSFIKKFIQ